MKTITVLFIVSITMTACQVDPFCIICSEGLKSRYDAEALDDFSSWDSSLDAESNSTEDDTGVNCDPTAEELCNGYDDNCDGLTDDGFDLSSDPYHCGECGNACQFLNADAYCESGKCVQSTCFDGFADLDSSVEGCEYRCPIFPIRGEECNGLDDDCDGEVDESSEITPPTISFCRITPHTPCENTPLVCRTVEGFTTWFCDYSEEVEFDTSIPNGIVDEEIKCDGLDGDCDGVADDSYVTLGDPCTQGEGVCMTQGERVCAESMDSVICNAPEAKEGSEEVCNGIDDDCDGEIDEDGFGDMVQIGDFWIDVYEASVPEEQTGSYGCSIAGRLPWTNVTWYEANDACIAAGKRLCKASEWQEACEGDSDNIYPYGSTYDPNICNGQDYDADCSEPYESGIQLTGTPYGCPSKPAVSGCVTPDGIYDLSGNAREWTSTKVGDQPSYQIRGGSYDNIENGLTCQSDFQLATADFYLDNLGFRCCRDD